MSADPWGIANPRTVTLEHGRTLQTIPSRIETTPVPDYVVYGGEGRKTRWQRFSSVPRNPFGQVAGFFQEV